ncbi:MAG TPA: type IV pilin protein [Steroidobacteraceae bacterium]|jgi:type IV pilus assembly protein PilE
MEPTTAPTSSRGFSLIELMVVVAIATILFSLAVPSFMAQIRQSRRTEAKTAVLDLAGREERFFSTSGAGYSQTPGDLGYTALGVVVGSGYYTLRVCTPAAAACGATAPPGTWVVPAAPSYLAVALPAAGQSQVKDTQCVGFFVDSTGKQMAVDSSGADATAACWSR